MGLPEWRDELICECTVTSRPQHTHGLGERGDWGWNGGTGFFLNQNAAECKCICGHKHGCLLIKNPTGASLSTNFGALVVKEGICPSPNNKAIVNNSFFLLHLNCITTTAIMNLMSLCPLTGLYPVCSMWKPKLISCHIIRLIKIKCADSIIKNSLSQALNG